MCRWLKQNKHLRYMWIPYTDSVVVVKCNPTAKASPPGPGFFGKTFTADEKLGPLRQLLQGATGEAPAADLSATQLRDELIKANPLDKEWIKKVNQAEAEFWKRNSGSRVGWSDEILGFDCGGQQWVLEVAFPTDTGSKSPQVRVLASFYQRWGHMSSAGDEDSRSSGRLVGPVQAECRQSAHGCVAVDMSPTFARQGCEICYPNAPDACRTLPTWRMCWS